MVTLDFTLTPEAAAKIHDILICLSKFSDAVSIEARRERFTFTALNSSKSAYAAIALDGKRFFSQYECVPSNGHEGRFTCSMYTKALLSVFKGRLDDPRGRDGAIDRCEVSVQDRPDQTECRFIVKMFSNQGVTKTYKLTYEAVEVMHALFDKDSARNRWSIRTNLLREYIEYFGTKTENLDICAAEDGRAIFKSYTVKITNGKEVLKHPLVTAVAVNTSDFDNFNVQGGLHIIINVKDFKAIAVHADAMKTSLRAYYSQPTRPLQFNYSSEGMNCEFTLMTAGEYNASPTATPAPVQATTTNSRAQSAASEHPESRNARTEMPPPAEPASRRAARQLKNPGSVRRETSPKQAEADPESLFVQQDEGDSRWDPVDYENQEETLGWDASAETDAAVYPTFRDSGSLARTDTEDSNGEALAPTQRMSQIEGLW